MGHTCSTTYFDAVYPSPAATAASGSGASGTGPEVGSHAFAMPMDDVTRSRSGAGRAEEISAARSTSARTPATCGSNDWRARLKLTVHALCMMCVTSLRTCSIRVSLAVECGGGGACLFVQLRAEAEVLLRDISNKRNKPLVVQLFRRQSALRECVFQPCQRRLARWPVQCIHPPDAVLCQEKREYMRPNIPRRAREEHRRLPTLDTRSPSFTRL